ncbi:MAG: stage II sporulation protein M [Bacilli bacterium]
MVTNSVTNTSLKKQKKQYLLLMFLILGGMILGIIYAFFLKEGDQALVKGTLDTFFMEIKDGNLHYQSGLITSVSSNFIYTFLIWVLGISVIGIIFVLFLLLARGFIVGFAIGSIITRYGFKGLLGAFCYIFPHHLLNILFSVLLSFYAIKFSIKLINYLFFKKDINFKIAMKKYGEILLICLGGFFFSSLLEVFVSPFLIKFFTKII